MQRRFEAALLEAGAQYDALYESFVDDGIVEYDKIQDVLGMLLSAYDLADEVLASYIPVAGKVSRKLADAVKRARGDVLELAGRISRDNVSASDAVVLYTSLEVLFSLKNGVKNATQKPIYLKIALCFSGVLLLVCAAVWFWCARYEGLSLDLLATTSTVPVVTKGLDDPENDKGFRWRWSLGRDVFITFDNTRKEPCVLDLAINNFIPGQQVEVYINERLVRVVQNIPLYAWNDPGLSVSLPFVSVAGENRIHLVLSQWNRKDSKEYVPDPRPLGVKFFSISLRSDSSRDRISRMLGRPAGK